MEDERVTLSVDDAIERLDTWTEGDSEDRSVHTFLSSPIGLIGADWSLKSIREAMERGTVELSGEQATAMNHGIVILEEGKPPVFVATKVEENG